MDPWIVDGLLVLVLVLAGASGCWMWLALRDPPPRVVASRDEPPPAPIPAPTHDLVSVQARWRLEHADASPVPLAQLAQFPAARRHAELTASVTVLSQPPMERTPPERARRPVDEEPDLVS